MKILRGLQRVAVTSGTAIATLAGVAYLSDSPRSSPERTPSQYLKDATYIWTQKTAEVSQAAVSLIGTVKDTCVAVSTGSISASDNLLRSFVSRVEEWSEHPVKCRTLVVVGGNILLDWVLRKAASKSSPDQLAAERAICNLLSNDATASVLLHLDGAIPRLLQLVAQSSDTDRLAIQLSWAVSVVSFPVNASLDDFRDTITLVNGNDGNVLRSLAVQCLGRWAESSVLNCGKIATMQGGPALAKALASAGRAQQDKGLCANVAQAMAILARDCPLRSLLGMDAWLQQLLFWAADATASGDYRLVNRALDAFSTCLMHGSKLQDAVERSNAWALLDQLAFLPDPDIRRAVTLAVTAVSRYHLPDAQRQFWSSLLLAWLCADKDSGEAQRQNVASALDALAATPGHKGLTIASTWLGDMLISLSRNVKTYSSIRVGGREMTEEVTQDHVPVVPAYARSIAHDLRDAYDKASVWQEPPIDMEQLLRPSTGFAAQSELMTLEEAVIADQQLCRSLKILCAMVSSDEGKQRWLQSAGIIGLLQRLTLDSAGDIEGGEADQDLEDKVMSGATKRQCARLLAMIAASGGSQALRRNQKWLQWLRRQAVSNDCKLSSHASRALLHLEAAEVFQPSVSQDVSFDGLLEPSAATDAFNVDAREEAKVTAASKPARQLILKDGVHLFSPAAEHHRVLAREGITSTSPGAPLIDICFVHGIRGGPFASWRAGIAPRGSASENLTHNFCWPSEWLSKDVPQARLLSLEYAAPASGWEGESLPLRGTVGQLMDKLAAAGVGQRPCIFICHSMGGILTKEMIAKALADASPQHRRNLATSTAGLIFYACPHTGSWLADIGWTLRFVGASPAASVLHLRPGKHLEEVNDMIRQLHVERHVPVLSFGEGSPTSVMMTLPQLVVVPEGSAYPGYGSFVLLPGVDHINACKPILQEDASYIETLRFIQDVISRLEAKEALDIADNA